MLGMAETQTAQQVGVRGCGGDKAVDRNGVEWGSELCGDGGGMGRTWKVMVMNMTENVRDG